jgi:nucleoside-diphosphate-sugar epimerase
VKGTVTDTEHLFRVIQENEIDRIVHLAYMVRPQCEENPLEAINVNCKGTTNAFEAGRQLGISRIVWASSIAVFGSPQNYNEESIGDDAPHQPQWFYGICKSFNELTARYYFRKFGVPSIGLRVGRAFGWGKWTGGGQELNKILECVALSKPVHIPNADTLTSYSYIKDIALAFLAALEVKSVPKTRVFNMHGDYYTGWELTRILERINPEAQIMPTPGIAELNVPKMKVRAIEKELNWRPQYQLREALRETLNIFRAKAGLPALLRKN